MSRKLRTLWLSSEQLKNSISRFSSLWSIPECQNGEATNTSGKQYMQTRHEHIPELQSLRGIAAIIVLLHHSSFVFTTSQPFHYWAEVLLNAHAAVILFFVLSGYVLSRSLSGVEANIRSLRKFYLARIFRIYPPLWFACAFALVYLSLSRNHPSPIGISPWYIGLSPVASWVGAIKSICFAGMALVPPLWSVRVELLGSLLLPLIVLTIQRGLGLWLLSITVAISLLPLDGKYGVAFIPCFVLGALAFRYQSRFGYHAKSLSGIAGSALLLLFFRRVNPLWRFEINYEAVSPLLVESLAAAILIVGLVERRSDALRSRTATYLGDISYSVYLLHFTVMAGITFLIALLPGSGDIHAVALMVATLGITLPLAAISYGGIEIRGISLGKRLYSALVN
jgi:peptidoglycan/LPS O-acetylase OafA/YrhL